MTVRAPGSSLAALLAAVVLAGCGPGAPEGTWVRADMMELPEGVAADELPASDSRGARLAVRYCSQCHGVPSPVRHSADDWIPTLRRMFARMEHMSGMGRMRGMMGRDGGMMDGMGRGRGMPMGRHGIDAPSEVERSAIVEYYRAHALSAVEPEAVPGGEGAEIFRDRCSRCHALPDPALHTPTEWPGVVERMEANMERSGVAGLSAEERAAIVGYLRRASRAGDPGPER